MQQAAAFWYEELTIENIRLKPTERECPHCDAIIMLNETEQCFECLRCGYIDCGDEDC